MSSNNQNNYQTCTVGDTTVLSLGAMNTDIFVHLCTLMDVDTITELSKTNKEFRDTIKENKRHIYERCRKHIQPHGLITTYHSAPSAYMMFCQLIRPIVKEANPQIGGLEMIRAMARLWAAQKDEERVAHYKRLAQEERVKQSETVWHEGVKIGDTTRWSRSGKIETWHLFESESDSSDDSMSVGNEGE